MLSSTADLFKTKQLVISLTYLSTARKTKRNDFYQAGISLQ